MDQPPRIFDHALIDAHYLRALKQGGGDADFLWQELASRMLDRLDDVRRTFPMALDLGCHHGKLSAWLAGKYGIQELKQLQHISGDNHTETLPLEPQSMDLILSIASLQWANDLPGCLMQMLHALKPDGLCIAMIPGEETLIELRQSLDAAMLQCTGGISPRISPMLGLKDASDLMQRAGFALPVVDRERITICYASPMKLMHDLRAMGQTNALIDRSAKPLTKTLIKVMQTYYADHFPHPKGGVSATFDIITLTGWAPDPSQAKPLARGSAGVSMKDVL